jgi:tRNA-2-methylthio-N6-dimethylallyladenosine synthase
MTADLLTTIRDLPKCSPYLHVPAQSGDDEVLKRMKRGYTVSDYLEMMDRIETLLPGATVSSDFIVGFSGETEEQFQRSIRLVERCRFKNSFIFQYSVRPGTKAAERLPDDIPREVKARRNQELLAAQDAIALEDQQRLIGRTFDVLVEGPSKKAQQHEDGSELVQMMGRTHCDRIVVFDGNRRQAGQILPVKIDDALCHTLIGRVQTVELVSIGAFRK